jgi:protein-export membrane protein SecD
MSLRWRAILNGVLVLLLAWSALPSLVSESTRTSSALIPDRAMTLGLDLQGGIHWLLRVDEKAVAVQEARSLDAVIETEAEDRRVAITGHGVREDGALELEGDSTALRALIEDVLDEVTVDEAEGKLLVRATELRNEAAVRRAVEQSIEVLRRRIDDLGVREPLIAPHGDDRILVQMPGADIDPEQAAEALRKATFLEFKEVLGAAANEELLKAQFPGGIPEDQQIVFEYNYDPNDKAKRDVREAVLVPKQAVLTGDMLDDARVGFDRRNKPIILFTWNREGARIFGEFTQEHVGDRLAAIIDGEVVTSPTIRSRIRREGQIEGSFTQQEASRVASSLRSGSLPIPLIIEEERTVGPALGQDAIESGIRSLILGMALVVLFMIAYYRVAGWIANAALVVNLILILGAMSLLGATLTLPGIAGLVLTVGMAVDSNVIIYERIREELRKGAAVKTAVQIGFSRSALTILDANVTTLFAALILLWLGRGPVQGFGVTLAIGILTTVYAALIVTRLLFDYWLSRNPTKLRI